MIEKVTDLHKKSFKHYTGPTDKFKLKNVVFGYNGRGKSSLALGIKDEYLRDSANDKDGVRFFNQDFVDDNLVLRDPITGERGKLKGVIAHFSAEDVKSEEKIKKLQEKLVDVKPLQEKLDELTNDTRKIIDSIHDRRKGTANIQKRDKNMPIEEVVRLYGKDVDDAKKIEGDENKLGKIEGDNLLGEKIELVKTVSFESFGKILPSELSAAKEVFEKSFENVSIPASEVVDWLNSGIKLHTDGDNCKFCGGQLALDDITAKVEDYNKNEKQLATKLLQALDQKVAELQNVITRNQSKKDAALAALDKDYQIDVAFAQIEKFGAKVAEFRGILQEKIKNIDNKKLNFIDISDGLQELAKALSSLDDIKNSQLAKLESQNNNKSTLVKGAIGLEIANDANIQTKLAEIKVKRSDIENAGKTNKTLAGQIQDLKQAESATADFANYISEILVNLNVHLKLSVSDDGKNYVIMHTKTTDKLTMADISEGERNLLALLFFYYELFDDNEQQDFKSDIELIVIDDPISSMDDVNKMYIMELMKQVLTLPTPQVFIMTHSWDDFTGLCYGLSDKPATLSNPATPYGFYEIKKNVDGNSLVQKTKSNISPYDHNFLEVYDFSQKPDTTNLEDCEIYHMPNIIRQVLEGFLKFKVKNASPTHTREKEIAKVLFAKEWSAIKEEKKTKLGQLLSVINVNSHDSSRSPDEILASAKFLMTRISKVDEQHYNTHKEPIT